jgi:hypothetical protein
VNSAKLSASLLAISLLIPPELSGQRTAQPTPQPVAVWCGGDDGLTSKLRDATEQAFKATRDLPLGTKDRHAVYKVLIPTNVDWKQVGSRTKVLYTIKLLTIDQKEVGSFKGSCWESSIGTCADQIVNRTRDLLSKMNRSD